MARYHGLVDVVCSVCGTVYRANAHSVECVGKPWDQRWLTMAEALTADEMQREIEKKKNQEG